MKRKRTYRLDPALIARARRILVDTAIRRPD
jgi:hypothetical protein